MTMRRRTLMLAALAAAVALPNLAGAADTYPERPVTLIVPYPAGGNADVAVRVLAEGLEKELGTSVVVSPTPGAGGVTGIQKVLSSKPDGYTILVAAQSSITIPTQTRKLRFAWDTPQYIATIAAPSTYIGVDAKNTEIDTFDKLVAHARANPGAMNVAVVGKAGLQQVIVLRVKKRFDIDVQSIPFNGGPPAVSAVLGGHADFLVTDNYNAALRPLAITGAPTPHYPDVKTLAEMGYPELQSGVNYIVAAPAGTPQPILDKLEKAFAGAVEGPKYQEVLASLKWGPLWRDQTQTREVVAAEAAAVKQLIADKLLPVEGE